MIFITGLCFWWWSLLLKSRVTHAGGSDPFWAGDLILNVCEHLTHLKSFMGQDHSGRLARQMKGWKTLTYCLSLLSCERRAWKKDLCAGSLFKSSNKGLERVKLKAGASMGYQVLDMKERHRFNRQCLKISTFYFKGCPSGFLEEP